MTDYWFETNLPILWWVLLLWVMNCWMFDDSQTLFMICNSLIINYQVFQSGSQFMNELSSIKLAAIILPTCKSSAVPFSLNTWRKRSLQNSAITWASISFMLVPDSSEHVLHLNCSICESFYRQVKELERFYHRGRSCYVDATLFLMVKFLSWLLVQTDLDDFLNHRSWWSTIDFLISFLCKNEKWDQWVHKRKEGSIFKP